MLSIGIKLGIVILTAILFEKDIHFYGFYPGYFLLGYVSFDWIFNRYHF